MSRDELKYSVKGSHLCIPVRVQPRSSANRVVGLFDGALKVQLTSPPVEDRANRQLVNFLASVLGVAAARVQIVRGGKSRNKTVAVEGLSIEELWSVIRSLPCGSGRSEPGPIRG